MNTPEIRPPAPGDRQALIVALAELLLDVLSQPQEIKKDDQPTHG